MTITITPQVEQNAAMVQMYHDTYQKALYRWSDFQYKMCYRYAGPRPIASGWGSPVMNVWENKYNEVWESTGKHRDRYVNTYMARHGFTEGWVYVGSGCYRSAYRGPDGLVYKVGTKNDNEADARISQRMSKIKGKPRLFHFPDMHLVGDVLVTEYVQHTNNNSLQPWEEERAWERVIKWARKHGVKIQDQYGDNTLWDGKRFVFVDLGNWNDGENAKFVNDSQQW